MECSKSRNVKNTSLNDNDANADVNSFHIDKWITRRKKKLKNNTTLNNRYGLLDVQQIGVTDNYDDDDDVSPARTPIKSGLVKRNVTCFINQKPERDNMDCRRKNVVVPGNAEYGKKK